MGCVNQRRLSSRPHQRREEPRVPPPLAGRSDSTQTAVVVGQFRGEAEPRWAEFLRCAHPGLQMPCGPEKGGQGGLQRGADMWAELDGEGGKMRKGIPEGERRRAKVQLARLEGLVLDNDPGRCESLELLKSMKAIWLQVTDAHLNTNRDSRDSSMGCSQAQGGLRTRCGKDTSRATHRRSQQHQQWGTLVQALPLESMTQPSSVLGLVGEGTTELLQPLNVTDEWLEVQGSHSVWPASGRGRVCIQAHRFPDF